METNEELLAAVIPPENEYQAVICVKPVETPIGTMFAAAAEQGVCMLEFPDRKRLARALKDLSKQLRANVAIGEHPHFGQLESELKEYFAAKRKNFTIPLHFPGTEFQQNVWNRLLLIPYGGTRSYKQQAQAIQKPEAVRAVGHANGMNRISIIVPCHRVIGENGSLAGYGGGIPRKQWLLEFERANL